MSQKSVEKNKKYILTLVETDQHCRTCIARGKTRGSPVNRSSLLGNF